MNLTLRQIRYVCEVARQGSIQKASQALRISQSSILAAIAMAESQLDAKIFDRRQSRGVLVTSEGERFLNAARALMTAEGEFSRSIGLLGQGKPDNARIGCFVPFGPAYMIDVLKAYQERCGIGSIDLMEGGQPQLREWLATGEIEFAVTYDIGRGMGDGHTPICELPAHAALPASHPLANRESVALADLVDTPFILLDLPETSVYLMTLFDVIAKRPHVALRSTSYETVRAAIANGMGFSLLNTIPRNDFSRDRAHIVRVPLTDQLPAPKVIVADLYGHRKPAHVTMFIEILKDYFSHLPRVGIGTPSGRQEPQSPAAK
ncbi:LysR family transcriptional regulator [Rhizobium sp. PAMB 3174]